MTGDERLDRTPGTEGIVLFKSAEDRGRAAAIARLIYCNPFLPERLDCEKEALGDDYVPVDPAWHVGGDPPHGRANLVTIQKLAEELAAGARQRLAGRSAASSAPSAAELAAYEDLVLYLLYYRHREIFEQLILAQPRKLSQAGLAQAFDKFVADVQHFFALPGPALPFAQSLDPSHLFACFFQIRRAFFHIYNNIVGGSMPAARLRAAAWQSIFTHDMRRYRRVMFDRMTDITTLVTGPSGTGKELVARAIGLSRYIPFDAKTKSFTEDFAGSFVALNLSALSPTLIESELFGHRRGAYTGALEDRAGWLEVCPPLGTVFLDEIGELDAAIQVKLLRVIQTRTFQRLGDTATRHFKGKIIAATNRDLGREMAAGSFRTDFYYRLCSDLIRTPTLRDQAAASPEELRSLILFIAKRVIGEEGAAGLSEEVFDWIGGHLGPDYAWPGNFRELEQCVRNVLIRKEYHPAAAGSSSEAGRLAEDMRAGRITADELLRRYCSLVYSQTRNYEETARRLGLDRRTVKSKVTAGSPNDERANDE
jgi:transcriptional regulator with AAA-type ATPase domain